MFSRFSAVFFYKKRGKGKGSEGGFLTFVFFLEKIKYKNKKVAILPSLPSPFPLFTIT